MTWSPTELVLSPESIKKLAEVEQLIGKVEGMQLSRPVPKLRQKNRAKSIRGSTGIEGNSCSVEQVEAIADGQPVALSKKEQLEIRNALETYDALPSFDPVSIASLLDAQRMLMGNGLLLVPGRFRQGPVEVYVTETETLRLPSWKTVEPSVQALFDDLENGAELMLISSIRFHFEFVGIHPFSDGNGRMARLWQTRLLMEEHPVFEFLDVESMVFDRREDTTGRFGGRRSAEMWTALCCSCSSRSGVRWKAYGKAVHLGGTPLRIGFPLHSRPSGKTFFQERITCVCSRPFRRPRRAAICPPVFPPVRWSGKATNAPRYIGLGQSMVDRGMAGAIPRKPNPVERWAFRVSRYFFWVTIRISFYNGFTCRGTSRVASVLTTGKLRI